jgi:hypothetical protein
VFLNLSGTQHFLYRKKANDGKEERERERQTETETETETERAFTLPRRWSPRSSSNETSTNTVATAATAHVGVCSSDLSSSAILRVQFHLNPGSATPTTSLLSSEASKNFYNPVRLLCYWVVVERHTISFFQLSRALPWTKQSFFFLAKFLLGYLVFFSSSPNLGKKPFFSWKFAIFLYWVLAF